MKFILSAQENISEFFDLGKPARDFPRNYIINIVDDNDVESFIARKLKSGHQCVILTAEQLAYNEVLPTKKSLK